MFIWRRKKNEENINRHIINLVDNPLDKFKDNFELASNKVFNQIHKPSHISNFSKRRSANGEDLIDQDKILNIIDTFIIHDPGFYDLNNKIKDEKMKNISDNRKLEITIDELTLPNKKKSAHWTLDFEGNLYSHVPHWAKAWHAGNSSWNHRKWLNNSSLGIEVLEPYTEIQYYVLAVLINIMRDIYKKITPQNIIGHHHCSPDRKSDPLGFDWWKLYTYMNIHEFME